MCRNGWLVGRRHYPVAVPYHVRVSTLSQPSWDEVRLDLTEQDLEDRILRPYREGRPIVIGGVTVPPADLRRLRVSLTEKPSGELLAEAEQLKQRRPMAYPIEWYIADLGSNVTDDVITGPPGSDLATAPVSKATDPVPAAGPDPRSVFVVHGRNRDARDAMFTFLRAIGLQPIEWNEAVQLTNRPSPYIGEVLDTAFGKAQTVVVLMTPDDEVRLRSQFHQPNDPAYETSMTGQARPNVLFEAGMAMGRDADRTVLVEFGQCRPFSDIGGRNTLRFDGSSQRRQELAQRLQTAGASISLTGTDWHTAGDFKSPE